MHKKDYLNITKASDIKDKKERAWYRLLEMFPGVISIGTLLGVFIFSWLLPLFVAVFIICFCLYYLLRIFYFSINQAVAYLRITRNLHTDWLEKIKRIGSPKEGKKHWKKIYHLVILPQYKEGYRIIKETVESLIRADYPKENIIVILSTEERAGKEFREAAKRIEREYGRAFFKFATVVHPSNTEGEIAGKGSNVAYAGKAARELIESLHIPLENVLVSNFDIDTKVYPQYFSCLTWNFLTQKDPQQASYQPIPVYNNNIWKSNFFARVVSSSNTFWQMICQERPEKLTSYSSHAIPAKAFFEVGYPDNVVCDDSRIFWRAYLYYDGEYRVVPMYYLVSMDVVDSKTIFRTIINQYRQQRRWAWGVAEIPYVIFGFSNNKKISLWQKISHIYTLIDGYWSWATAALLLFLLGWLPIFLGGDKFNFTILSFNLPILTGRIMTFSLLGMLVSALLSTFLLPKVPKGVHPMKKITIFLQWLFLPVTLIIFGAFPALDAQIRLMLGRYMGFWVTEKIRK